MKQFLVLLLLLAANATLAGEASAPIKVNRSAPKVELPKAGLEFSTKPTVQEIFRARVFEEPLVPIGG